MLPPRAIGPTPFTSTFTGTSPGAVARSVPWLAPVSCAGHCQVVAAAESPGEPVWLAKVRADRTAVTTRGRNCSVSGCRSGDCRTAHRSHTAARESLRSSIRSEEHTSELQSLAYLVCRLLLEKKKE